MEVDEEDCGSGHFRFPDNSTALNAETIREDPAPSTSRMVVALSSRAFRANKTKERKIKLCSIIKPRRRKAIGGIRQKTPSADQPSASSETVSLMKEAYAKEPSSHLHEIEVCQLPLDAQLPIVQGPSSSSRDWRAREMTTIDEETTVPLGHVKLDREGFAPLSAAERRSMALDALERERWSGNTRHMDRLLAALRVNVQRMKAMSKDNPDALREALPDETIAMMRRFHI